MNDKIKEDLAEMKKKLREYVDKGREVGYREVRKEPEIAVKPDKSKIRPLRKIKNCDTHFLAVDCSTRTLKRANNWGIYLMRAAYASVEGRNVNWGYEESVTSVVGDRRARSNFLIDRRLQLESEMALKILCEESKGDVGLGRKALRRLSEGDYVLLDGASFFGGKRGFHTSLYEEALRKKVNLLTVSKQSPMLHDEKGRDLMAATCILAPHPTWIYHPVKEANKDKHLYGDVSLVKLCQDSLRVFRCDIMEYLTNRDISELLSPLTAISEDPRCLGYPVTLWLAHDFSSPSDSKLLHYHDQVEETLVDAGLLDVIRLEELSCSFPDELHGVKHPFRWERIEHV
jgi:hypothetical protein